MIRLTDNVKQSIREHCLIPHSQSHYDLEDSRLLYFENPELTLSQLYLLFVEYYTKKRTKRHWLQRRHIRNTLIII